MITPDQVADMLAAHVGLRREQFDVGEWWVGLCAPSGAQMAVSLNSDTIAVSVASAAPGEDAARCLFARIDIPHDRPDLIPWAIEHVSTIALQARAHGVP